MKKHKIGSESGKASNLYHLNIGFIKLFFFFFLQCDSRWGDRSAKSKPRNKTSPTDEREKFTKCWSKMLFSLQDKLIRKIRLEPYGLKFDQWAIWTELKGQAVLPFLLIGSWDLTEVRLGTKRSHFHCKFIYFGEKTFSQLPFLLFHLFISVYNNDYIIWYYWNWNILNICIFSGPVPIV